MLSCGACIFSDKGGFMNADSIGMSLSLKKLIPGSMSEKGRRLTYVMGKSEFGAIKQFRDGIRV